MSRAEPPPKYSMMIHSLVPYSHTQLVYTQLSNRSWNKLGETNVFFIVKHTHKQEPYFPDNKTLLPCHLVPTKMRDVTVKGTVYSGPLD